MLSTEENNGGYTKNLTHVFNHKSGYGYVSMQNVCIETGSFRDITVTAIVTASPEVDGGRPGGPAEYYEEADPQKAGTINIMLHVNAGMSPGCMTRAVVTLTEAKTAAMQELMAGSLYFGGLAAGSGSDSVIVVSDGESPHHLTYAGGHSKLGELIGLTVKAAVTKGLEQHMNLTPETQHSVEARTRRCGLTAQRYWETAKNRDCGLDGEAFKKELEKLDTRSDMVVPASLYIHLIDQVSWGLLSPREVEDGANRLLCAIARAGGVDCRMQTGIPGKAREAVDWLAEAFQKLMVALAERNLR